MARLALILSTITAVVALLGGARWAVNEWRLWRRRRLILLLVLMFGLPSWAAAATYYVDFTGGADANNGTSTATPWKRVKGMTGVTGTAAAATISGGDTIVFKGGVTWTAFYPWTLQGGASSAVTYTTDHSWFTGGAWSQPIFDGEASSPATSTGIARITGSWVTINDTKWYRCGVLSSNTESATCLVFEDATNIAVTNNTFDGRTWFSIYFLFSSSGTRANFTVTGNDFTNTTSAVWFASAAASAVEQNFVYTGNTIHDFAPMLGCSDIADCPGPDGAHGDGFLHFYTIAHDDATQYLDGFTFCNNRSYGDFTRGIGTVAPQDMTAMIYVEGAIKNGLICNNDFNFSPKENSTGSPGSIFEAVIDLRDYDNTADGAMYVLNNTIRGSFTTRSGSAAILASSGWSNLVVKNNAIEFELACLYGENSAPTGAHNYNNRYCPSPNIQWTGEGANSISTDNLFVSAASSALQATSPNIGAGENLSGLGLSAPQQTLLDSDFNGVARGATWDIGAYEYVSGTGSHLVLVLRQWIDILVPAAGLGWHFRRILTGAVFACVAWSASTGGMIQDATKTTVRAAAVKVAVAYLDWSKTKERS